jgi:hypothetical protein
MDKSRVVLVGSIQVVLAGILEAVCNSPDVRLL